MRIKLAGFNTDVGLMGLESADMTPETISAAYARISRDPRPVDELRADAIKDVAKARASNEQIVFGLGHASVAEHAVFNFDIMGVSRLVIEAIEHARLCSYTEKSQRYTRLKDDFVVPKEIVDVGLEAHFRNLMAEQFRAYQILFEGICDHLLAQNPEATREERKAIEGKAKEDARYVTSLAVEGQLGMTCNARNLEYMIRRLLFHPLEEARSVGRSLYDEAKSVAPSLLRYLEPTQEQLRARLDMCDLPVGTALDPPPAWESVRLLSWDKNGDNKVMAALLHTYMDLDLEQCERYWMNMDLTQSGNLIRSVFKHLQPWDSVPRAFELVDFQFELVVSASCFAQLKRHRMATLLPQGYNVDLGYTMPPLVQEAKKEQLFHTIMKTSQDFHDTLVLNALPMAASYALTQAHRRRVIVKMNARELYHFSRLRQDNHAQWDIRAIADRMVAMAERECPLAMLLACGKDAFERRKEAALDGLL